MTIGRIWRAITVSERLALAALFLAIAVELTAFAQGQWAAAIMSGIMVGGLAGHLYRSLNEPPKGDGL